MYSSLCGRTLKVGGNVVNLEMKHTEAHLMDLRSNGGSQYQVVKTLIRNSLQSCFPSCPMKSENILVVLELKWILELGGILCIKINVEIFKHAKIFLLEKQ